MPKIVGFRVQNYGVLKDVGIGSLWRFKPEENRFDGCHPLTPMTALIGENGSGKSTLIDAFGFLADCLEVGVEEACDMRGRGGFQMHRSSGQDGPIGLKVYFQDEGPGFSASYILQIRPNMFKCLDVVREDLFLIEDSKPDSWLVFSRRGEKYALRESVPGKQAVKLDEAIPAANQSRDQKVDLDNLRNLGLSHCCELREHPLVSRFRRFLQSCHVSSIVPRSAQMPSVLDPHEHLSSDGSNLASVLQYMHRKDPPGLRDVLRAVSARVPSLSRVWRKETEDGRLLLRFKDKDVRPPLFAQQMSDGIWRLVAHQLLLAGIPKRPFLCIEHPENGLHHNKLEALVHQFRESTSVDQGSAQILLTTHHPYVVDAMDPCEVWAMARGKDGFATIMPVAELPNVQRMVDEGQYLGSLWYSGHLDPK